MQLAGRQVSYLPGTILPNGTISNEIDISEYALIGLKTITSMTSGTLQFFVSEKPEAQGGAFGPVRALSGGVKESGSLSGIFALDASDLSFLAPYRYLRVVTSVAQASGLAFALPVKM